MELFDNPHKKYLDHGHVVLLDVMGSDEDIEYAARMSYANSTRTVSQTQSLLDFLMRHEHTSPFEMAEIKFQIKIPIFVMRQLVRHRTACISGDQNLIFDLGSTRQGYGSHPISIKKFHDMWHYGWSNNLAPYEYPHLEDDKWYNLTQIGLGRNRIESSNLPFKMIKAANNKVVKHYLGKDVKRFMAESKDSVLRKRLKRMRLRCCDSLNNITYTNVTDIWSNGIKPVYEVTVDDGRKIKMTLDHNIKTESGWSSLAVATNIKLRDKYVESFDNVKIATNGVSLVADENWLNSQYDAGMSNQEIADIAGITVQEFAKIRSHSRTVEQKKAMLTRLRSGEGSNFCKGGICDEGTKQVVKKLRKLKQDAISKSARCLLTGSTENLEIHHITPKWMDNSDENVFNLAGIVVLSRAVHKKIHSNNLEFVFKDYIENGLSLKEFVEKELPNKLPPSKEKQEKYFDKMKGRVPHNKLTIAKFRNIVDIKYVGDEEVFDLTVSSHDHNFVCNGIIVHNCLNEQSLRYSKATDEFYVPALSRMNTQSSSNKQCSSEELIDWPAETRNLISVFNENAFDGYTALLDSGLSREIARGILPVNGYTEVVWKIDLKNLMHFLKLRLHSHAQKEIQWLAQAMYDLLKETGKFDLTLDAFERYILNARKMSSEEMKVLQFVFNSVDKEDIQEIMKLSGAKLSAREINELKDKLNVK